MNFTRFTLICRTGWNFRFNSYGDGKLILSYFARIINLIMDEEQLIKLLIELSELPAETEWVEFKVNRFNPEEVGRLISALSNSANLCGKQFGYLIFGVKDDNHEIVGTSIKPKIIKEGNEEIENWIMRGLRPHLDFKIYEFNCDKNTRVVLFEVPSATDLPVSFMDKAYIRIGSYTKELSDYPDKERQI